MTAQGSPTSRAWLLTVLGEYVLPSTQAQWTAVLLDALGAVGVEPKAARQALARTAGRGWLDAERVGRRTRWGLTGEGQRLLTTGTERIYSFRRNHPAWDGQWVLLLVGASTPGASARYRLRSQLGWAGFAPVAPGVWLSPRADREAEALAVAAELGLPEVQSFVGQPGRGTDLATLAADAWDLAGIEARYEAFLALAGRLRPRSPAAAFVALTTLVHHWRAFPLIDPDLPPELLPTRWKGDQAATRFHELHARFRDAAWAWWDERVAAAAIAGG